MCKGLVIAGYALAAVLELAGIAVILYYLRQDRAAAKRLEGESATAASQVTATPEKGYMSRATAQSEAVLEAVTTYAARADAELARGWTSGRRAAAPLLIAAGVLVALVANVAALWV